MSDELDTDNIAEIIKKSRVQLDRTVTWPEFATVIASLVNITMGQEKVFASMIEGDNAKAVKQLMAVNVSARHILDDAIRALLGAKVSEGEGGLN